MGYYYKDRCRNQWNWIESPEKHSSIWSNEFWQGCQDYSMGKGQSFQKIVLGKLDIHMQKNEVGLLSNMTFF